jgi:hypothetical protein
VDYGEGGEVRGKNPEARGRGRREEEEEEKKRRRGRREEFCGRDARGPFF